MKEHDIDFPVHPGVMIVQEVELLFASKKLHEAVALLTRAGYGDADGAGSASASIPNSNPPSVDAALRTLAKRVQDRACRSVVCFRVGLVLCTRHALVVVHASLTLHCRPLPLQHPPGFCCWLHLHLRLCLCGTPLMSR